MVTIPHINIPIRPAGVQLEHSIVAKLPGVIDNAVLMTGERLIAHLRTVAHSAPQRLTRFVANPMASQEVVRDGLLAFRHMSDVLPQRLGPAGYQQFMADARIQAEQLLTNSPAYVRQYQALQAQGQMTPALFDEHVNTVMGYQHLQQEFPRDKSFFERFIGRLNKGEKSKPKSG